MQERNAFNFFTEPSNQATNGIHKKSNREHFTLRILSKSTHFLLHFVLQIKGERKGRKSAET